MPENLNPIGNLSAQSAADKVDFNLDSQAAIVTCVTPSQESNAAPCPNCGNIRTNLVRMPEGCKHWAAMRCAICDCFIAWQAKPENTVKRSQQQQLIAQLLESSKLTQWERTFLEGLKGKQKLSPKQQEVLVKIEAKVEGV